MMVSQLRPGWWLIGLWGFTAVGCASNGAVDGEPAGSSHGSLSSLQLSVLAGSVGQGGSVDGAGSAARFGNLYGVTVSKSGDVFVAETLAIRKIGADAAVTTFSALPSYGFDPPDYPDPRGIAVDDMGGVYVSNNNIYTVDRFTGSGVFNKVAGDLFGGELNHQEGVAVDASGNLYIADTWNDRVVKVAPGGPITTFASGFLQPRGLAVDGSGNVLVADTDNHAIRRIAPNGAVTTIAGSPSQTSSVDGPVSAAGFVFPSAVTAGLDGTIYVVDGTTIRKISQGAVSTLVGVAGQSALTLGTLPASLDNPSGVAITSHGDLIITERFRNVVLEVQGAGPDCSSGACSVYSEPGKVLADFPACSNGDLNTTLATACAVTSGEVPLAAGAFDSATPPQLTVGTTYGVRLAAGAGQNGGTVAFTAPSTGEYLVYLGTPNVPFSTDGEAPACARYLSEMRVDAITGGRCDKFRGVYSLPEAQSGEQVRIRLGELTPQSWVRVLVLRR